MNGSPTPEPIPSKLAELVSAGEIPLEAWGAEIDRGRPKGSGRSTTIGGRWVQTAYVLVDLFFVCLNTLAVFSIWFFDRPMPPVSQLATIDLVRDLPLHAYMGFLLLYAALIVLCCQTQDLYWTPRNRTALDESFAVSKAVILATGLLIVFIYLSGNKAISRLVVAFSGVLNLTTLVAWRLWKRRIVQRRVAKGYGTRSVLIVGAGKVGRTLARLLKENKQLGYVVKGFLDQNHHENAQILGRIEDLRQVARAQFVDEIFITIPSERELVKSVTLEARRHRLEVKVVPELYDGLGWHAPLRYVGDFPVMELHWEPIPAFGLFLKRLIDIVVSALSLPFLAPLLAIIAFMVKLGSPGPVLYRSWRVGKKGRKFVCYKFRTMVANADEIKDQLRHLNERDGPFFKISDDPRVTRLGGFLRKYSLDELPQLWNVLRGDMSLVGPRPHPLDDYQKYSLEHLRRLDVKPGITGLWQVTARQDPSFEKNLALDLEYIEKWTLWLDLKILLGTPLAVFEGTGT